MRLLRFVLISTFTLLPWRVEAQTRQVTGTITEDGTNAPIGSAQVRVKGTTVGTLSREDGGFTLAVPQRDVILEIRRIGYPLTEVNVAANESTVRVVLRKDALRLEQVVITGQASGISRKNLPNSVASVAADEVSKVSAQAVDQALQGKIAGAQISTSTGAPGGGNRVRIRGIASILGSAQPLYVVDGVIVSDVAIGNGTNKVTGAAGNAISVANQESPVNRIADLNPNDIESVEVLKGSAASAIYGSKAAGGVIVVTTKRGAEGRPHYQLRTGVGTSRLAHRFGQRKFQTLDDATRAFGASAAEYFDANRFIDYEDLAYGNEPTNTEATLSVSGGNADTRYFVSSLFRDEDAIVRNTFAKKFSLRVNLDQRLSPKLDLQVGTEVLRTMNDRGLFGNDNRGNSIAYTLTKIPSFLDLRQRPDGTWPNNPFYPSNPLHTIERFKNEEGVWRNISTARLTWNALSSDQHDFSFVGYGGTDILNQRNEVYSPPELQFEPLDGLPGTTVASSSANLQANLNLNAVHTWRPRNAMSMTSQVGTQFERRVFTVNRSSAQNLLGDLEVVTAGTVRDDDEQRLRVEDFGIFAQTEVLLGDRLLLTAGGRADRSSNNGDAGKFFLFPKASASYRFPDLVPKWIDEFKLRFAYGETGNQPLYGQKFTALDLSNIDGRGAFRVGTVRGADDIRPERQREYEYGFDATILDRRGTLDFTVFTRDISDLLITRTLAPASGYSAEVSNGAEMRVNGLEAALNLFPVQTSRLSWNTRVTWGSNRSKITHLPVNEFLLGTLQVGATRIREGRSATELVGNDTLPEPGKKLVPGGVIMGDGNPKWNAGWGNEVRWRQFSVYALVDRQLGGMLAAGTWRHYDLGQNSVDYDDPSPTGEKLGDFRRGRYLQVTRVYYQDASYTKLRELTLGWDMPNGWAQRVWSRVQSARVQLSGRNLAWWTDYRGGDPEAENFGAGNVPAAVQRNRELAAYPANRSYWLNFNVEF